MNEKYNLERMLREIANENAGDSTANRTLTQAEIKARVAARTRPAPAAGTGTHPPAGQHSTHTQALHAG